MKKWIVIVIVAIALGAIGYFAFNIYNQRQEQGTAQAAYDTVEVNIGSLTSTIGATGTVRSNQSAKLTWETNGTVGDVYAVVGDQVTQGEVLSELEQTSLPQNVILAQADLVNAQRQLDDLLNSQTQAAQAQKAVEDGEQALEDAQNPELAQAKTLQAIADAEKAVEDAQRRLSSLSFIADQTDIDIAKAELALAEKNLERAEDLYKPYKNKPETNLRRAQLLSNLAKAQQQYDSAVRKVNALQATGSTTDIAVAEANLDTAKAQLLETEREYERIKDGATPGDIALLQAQLDDAQREWDRLKDGPTAEDIASAQARVAAAEATLSQAWIKAPFAGTISISHPQIGDQVAPGTHAFRLDDLSTLYVDLDVSEIDINQVEPGQEVTLTFDAIRGKEYNGEVVDVGLIGTEIQGVVTFVVTIELTDADADIRPGMTSAVDIVVSQTDEALLVPNQTIRTNEGIQVVFMLDSSGELLPVAINLGASSSTLSEVIGGDLKEGDWIVINPKTADGIEELNFFSGDPEDMRQMRDSRNQFEDNSGLGGE